MPTNYFVQQFRANHYFDFLLNLEQQRLPCTDNCQPSCARRRNPENPKNLRGRFPKNPKINYLNQLAKPKWWQADCVATAETLYPRPT